MSKPVKILASARNEATQSAIRNALGSVSGVRLEMRNGALTDLLEDSLLDRRSQMMILDVDLQNDAELNTLNQVIEQVPTGLPIIVTANSAEVDRVRLLMRMGLADFIPQPIVEEDLLNSVEVAGRQLERSGLLERTGGHVISFSRPCGGMGATSMAVQSAFVVREARRKDYRICLVDLDLQSGNAGLYLDLESSPSVVDCLVEPDRIDLTLVQSMVHRHKGEFDVLPAPERPYPLDKVSTASLETLLHIMRQEYDLIILDTPPVWTGWMDMVLADTDLQFLVTQLTVPGIRLTRRYMDVLDERGLGQLPISIIVNRYSKSRFGGGIKLKEAEHALRHRIGAVLPSDYKTISEAINSGVSVAEVKRRNGITKGLAELLNRALRDLDQPAGAMEFKPHNAA